MAWQAVVICREKGTDTECYCVCFEDLGKNKKNTLWMVVVNYGLEPTVNKVYVHFQNIYTRCPGRNVPDFGRLFLKLKYTDITQNTYTQS